LPPPTGRYAVALTDSEGRTVSENEFWVLPASAKPQIEVGRKGFFQNEPLSLKFRNAPGNRYDWVVVYPEGSADAGAYLAWSHTGSRIEGDIALGATEAVSGWPLPPGRYTVSLMADDGLSDSRFQNRLKSALDSNVGAPG